MNIDVNLRLTPQATLKAVLGLRVLAILIQLAVLAMAVQFFQLSLPLPALLAGTGFLALSALGLGWRLPLAWPVTQLEVALQLLLDMGVLTWLLYFTGGAENGFISAYLVPIALAALTLQWGYSLALILLSIGAYSWLFTFHVPLASAHHSHVSDVDLHTLGMWVNFIVSASLIGGLLWLLAENIRRRDEQIRQYNETRLRNEYVVALGTLAASAAHELSTPLSTVALLADELALAVADNPQAHQDVALLKTQVQQCKDSLSTLLKAAYHPRFEQDSSVTLGELLDKILDSWCLLRPEIQLNSRFDCDLSQTLLAGPALAQVLFNLLNNAADASIAAGSAVIGFKIKQDAQQLMLEITDQGKGLDKQAELLAGRVTFSNKAQGSGLGLLLSHTSLSQWGASLSLHNQPGGGTLARIVLPLTPTAKYSSETP